MLLSVSYIVLRQIRLREIVIRLRQLLNHLMRHLMDVHGRCRHRVSSYCVQFPIFLLGNGSELLKRKIVFVTRHDIPPHAHRHGTLK